MKRSTPKTGLPHPPSVAATAEDGSTRLRKAAFAGSLVLSALILTTLSTLANPKPEYGKIEVLRDTWGIPHVFSETDAGHR